MERLCGSSASRVKKMCLQSDGCQLLLYAPATVRNFTSNSAPSLHTFKKSG